MPVVSGSGGSLGTPGQPTPNVEHKEVLLF